MSLAQKLNVMKTMMNLDPIGATISEKTQVNDIFMDLGWWEYSPRCEDRTVFCSEGVKIMSREG